MNLTARQQQIIDIVSKQPASISKIKSKLNGNISTPTINRDLSELVSINFLLKTGKGRSTCYEISSYYKLFAPISSADYFIKEVDDRSAQTSFNHDLVNILKSVDLFTKTEQEFLNKLKQKYQNNISNLSRTIYNKELERLTIELSWKSSQIEGNTYSLLETERLFLEQEFAENKTQEEATMLLNHKDALNYILDNKQIAKNINLKAIEEIHSILIKNLGVNRNIRSRLVGITGTAYKPLDNEYQIKESMEQICSLINSKNNGFEKALLALILISYIQPFEDGNKRTGRMVSNAILISHESCPLSYRSVDSLEYKKAMLLFYEQNNLTEFKKIFIEQNKFAVENYFS